MHTLKYQNYYLTQLLEFNKRLGKSNEELNFALLGNNHQALTETILSFMEDKICCDPLLKRKSLFYTRLFLDTYSPKNFPMLDNNFFKYTLEKNGKNLFDGYKNFIQDSQEQRLNPIDKKDFTLGENLAYTKGKIVFKNELFELICYTPQEIINSIPILLVPACINKYYIFDLQDKNSLIKWLVDNRQQVFVISWVNPTRYQAMHHNFSFADYVTRGVNVAISQIVENYGFAKVNLVGYCLGGIFTTLSANILKLQNKNYIQSLSFLASQLDFSEPCDFSIFLEPSDWQNIKNMVQREGMMDGLKMQNFFNFIRSKEMIYHYMIDNYFYGKEKKKFDILAWNGDSTNLCAQFYCEYIEFTYIQNLIAQKNKLKIDNYLIDISSIDVPSFFLGTINDHIVTWVDAYKSMQTLTNSEKTFVLGGSGHVAGVINPPLANKYNYLINDDQLNKTHEVWKEGATSIQGSWWPYWLKWMNKQNNKIIKNNYKKLPNLDNAPGEYIRQKI